MAEGSWCVSFWSDSGVVGHRLFCANLLTAHALGADIPLLTQQSLKEPANTHTDAKTHTYLHGIGPFPWLSVTFSSAEITSCKRIHTQNEQRCRTYHSPSPSGFFLKLLRP